MANETSPSNNSNIERIKCTLCPLPNPSLGLMNLVPHVCEYHTGPLPAGPELWECGTCEFDGPDLPGLFAHCLRQTHSVRFIRSKHMRKLMSAIGDIQDTAVEEDFLTKQQQQHQLLQTDPTSLAGGRRTEGTEHTGDATNDGNDENRNGIEREIEPPQVVLQQQTCPAAALSLLPAPLPPAPPPVASHHQTAPLTNTNNNIRRTMQQFPVAKESQPSADKNHNWGGTGGQQATQQLLPPSPTPQNSGHHQQIPSFNQSQPTAAVGDGGSQNPPRFMPPPPLTFPQHLTPMMPPPMRPPPPFNFQSPAPFFPPQTVPQNFFMNNSNPYHHYQQLMMNGGGMPSTNPGGHFGHFIKSPFYPPPKAEKKEEVDEEEEEEEAEAEAEAEEAFDRRIAALEKPPACGKRKFISAGGKGKSAVSKSKKKKSPTGTAVKEKSSARKSPDNDEADTTDSDNGCVDNEEPSADTSCDISTAETSCCRTDLSSSPSSADTTADRAVLLLEDTTNRTDVACSNLTTENEYDSRATQPDPLADSFKKPYYECAQCHTRLSTVYASSRKTKRTTPPLLSILSRLTFHMIKCYGDVNLYGCTRCSYETNYHAAVRQHINKNHKSAADGDGEVGQAAKVRFLRNEAEKLELENRVRLDFPRFFPDFQGSPGEEDAGGANDDPMNKWLGFPTVDENYDEKSSIPRPPAAGDDEEEKEEDKVRSDLSNDDTKTAASVSSNFPQLSPLAEFVKQEILDSSGISSGSDNNNNNNNDDQQMTAKDPLIVAIDSTAFRLEENNNEEDNDNNSSSMLDVICQNCNHPVSVYLRRQGRSRSSAENEESPTTTFFFVNMRHVLAHICACFKFRPYQCGRCDREASQLITLIRHVKEKHHGLSTAPMDVIRLKTNARHQEDVIRMQLPICFPALKDVPYEWPGFEAPSSKQS